MLCDVCMLLSLPCVWNESSQLNLTPQRALKCAHVKGFYILYQYCRRKSHLFWLTQKCRADLPECQRNFTLESIIKTQTAQSQTLLALVPSWMSNFMTVRLDKDWETSGFSDAISAKKPLTHHQAQRWRKDDVGFLFNSHRILAKHEPLWEKYKSCNERLNYCFLWWFYRLQNYIFWQKAFIFVSVWLLCSILKCWNLRNTWALPLVCQLNGYREKLYRQNLNNHIERLEY